METETLPTAETTATEAKKIAEVEAEVSNLSDNIQNTPVRLEPTAMFSMPAAFEHVQRIANVFHASRMVPDTYRTSKADCIIAVNMALQLGVHPLLFMQNSYVVHGKPGIESKLIIALVNTRGGFKHRLRFEFSGTGDSRACECWTLDKDETRLSRTINVSDAKRMGWWDKKESMWPKMTDQMLMYRSASWFARTYCPEVLMGMDTIDEIIDITPN